MDPAPRVNPNKLILGETKLIFWPTGRTLKKNWVGWSIGKIKIIPFDSWVANFLKIIFCMAIKEEKHAIYSLL